MAYVARDRLVIQVTKDDSRFFLHWTIANCLLDAVWNSPIVLKRIRIDIVEIGGF